MRRLAKMTLQATAMLVNFTFLMASESSSQLDELSQSKSVS
jgi:hypothetical protein